LKRISKQEVERLGRVYPIFFLRIRAFVKICVSRVFIGFPAQFPIFNGSSNAQNIRNFSQRASNLCADLKNPPNPFSHAAFSQSLKYPTFSQVSHLPTNDGSLEGGRVVVGGRLKPREINWCVV
jgi:hypothetical protein